MPRPARPPGMERLEVELTRSMGPASSSDAAAPPVFSAQRSDGFRRYVRAAAIVTALGYSLGYSTIGFGLLFLGAAWSLAVRRAFPWARTPIDPALAGFGAVLLVSAAASPYRGPASTVTLMLIVSAAVYFGSFAWLHEVDPGSRDMLLRAWALGACAAAATGLFYSATHYVEASPPGQLAHARAQIPLGVGPNGLGTTLLLGSLLTLGGVFHGSRGRRAVWAAGSLLCLLGLEATGSRASLIGWVIGAGYLAVAELRRRPWLLVGVMVSGLVLAVGAGAATPQLSGRARHIVTDVEGNRVKIWQTSLRMVAARPLLGSGFGTFERAYNSQRAPDMSPEPFAFNLWLNVAVETGLLGLAAALWVAVSTVLSWRRAGGAGSSMGPPPEDHLGRPVVAALWVGLLVDQLFDNTLFSIGTSAALWLLLIVTVMPERRPRRQETAA
jgi:O-Antigen ligase